MYDRRCVYSEFKRRCPLSVQYLRLSVVVTILGSCSKNLTKSVQDDDTKTEAVAVPPGSRQDAKTLAEMKADAAGEKWRAEAEANGEKPVEVGGPKGLEPTRYGDWERAGRCVDF